MKTVWKVLALVVLLLLTGSACGDSKPTRQDVKEKRVDDPVRRGSVSGEAGDVRLLAVRIERPDSAHEAGSNSALFLTLTNSGAADSLVAVSTVDARSVILRQGSEAPADAVDVPLPAGNTVSMQTAAGLHLELIDLKRDLGKGTFVPVTFRFATAGSVTLKVFVSVVDHQVVAPVPGADGSG